MLLPVVHDALHRDFFKLTCKPTIGGNLILLFQHRTDSRAVFLVYRPHKRRTGIFSHPRIGSIKDIMITRHVAHHIQQRDALCAAPDIPPHRLIPDFIAGAGGCVRTLCINHQLVVKAIFIYVGSRRQKRAPIFPIGGDLPHGLLGKLHIIFQFCHLIAPAFLSVSVSVFFFWESRFLPVIPNSSTGFVGFSTWMSTVYPHESRLDIEEGGRSRIRPSAHLRFFLSLSSYSRHAASAALLCPHGFSIISRSNELFVKYLTLPRYPPRFPPRRHHHRAPYCSAAARLSSFPARRTPQRRPQSTPPAARGPSSPSNRSFSPLPA